MLNGIKTATEQRVVGAGYTHTHTQVGSSFVFARGKWSFPRTVASVHSCHIINANPCGEVSGLAWLASKDKWNREQLCFPQDSKLRLCWRRSTDVGPSVGGPCYAMQAPKRTRIRLFLRQSSSNSSGSGHFCITCIRKQGRAEEKPVSREDKPATPWLGEAMGWAERKRFREQHQPSEGEHHRCVDDSGRGSKIPDSALQCSCFGGAFEEQGKHPEEPSQVSHVGMPVPLNAISERWNTKEPLLIQASFPFKFQCGWGQLLPRLRGPVQTSRAAVLK